MLDHYTTTLIGMVMDVKDSSYELFRHQEGEEGRRLEIERSFLRKIGNFLSNYSKAQNFIKENPSEGEAFHQGYQQYFDFESGSLKEMLTQAIHDSLHIDLKDTQQKLLGQAYSFGREQDERRNPNKYGSKQGKAGKIKAERRSHFFNPYVRQPTEQAMVREKNLEEAFMVQFALLPL